MLMRIYDRPITRFFMVYLLPTGLINLGNVFAYLFQLSIIRSLSVIDVGAFNALFALANVISAPAAVLPFAIARTMIATQDVEGAAGTIVKRSAVAGLLITVAILIVGALLVEPLRLLLRIEQQSTVLFAELLLCTTLLSGIAIGWLQGVRRHISSSLAMCAIPALRFFLGLWLIVWWKGAIDSATAAAAFPAAIVFLVGLACMRHQIREARPSLPKKTWREFGQFMLASSASSLLLLGFWNLDVVMVRAMFSPQVSGLYAVAAVLGRIPYLLSVAVANILFAEATRTGLDGQGHERAPRRVLLLNFVFAATLGFAAAIPLSLFTEPILAAFGGTTYAPAAPILRVLSYAMALLALLQIVVTYMLARNFRHILWLLGSGLLAFIALTRFCANDVMNVVTILAGTIGLLILACLWLVFMEPGRLSVTETRRTRNGKAS
jgi:O-antigen/teichoic acid export membrane protein